MVRHRRYSRGSPWTPVIVVLVGGMFALAAVSMLTGAQFPGSGWLFQASSATPTIEEQKKAMAENKYATNLEGPEVDFVCKTVQLYAENTAVNGIAVTVYDRDTWTEIGTGTTASGQCTITGLSQGQNIFVRFHNGATINDVSIPLEVPAYGAVDVATVQWSKQFAIPTLAAGEAISYIYGGAAITTYNRTTEGNSFSWTLMITFTTNDAQSGMSYFDADDISANMPAEYSPYVVINVTSVGDRIDGADKAYSFGSNKYYVFKLAPWGRDQKPSGIDSKNNGIYQRVITGVTTDVTGSIWTTDYYNSVRVIDAELGSFPAATATHAMTIQT